MRRPSLPGALWIDRVGLDFGRTALRAVRYRRSPWGQESVTHVAADLPPAASDRSLDGHARRTAFLGALQRFVGEQGLRGPAVTTALPVHDLFIRSVSLPFRDPKKLAEVVPFEIENLIPLPLEDVVIESLALPPPSTGSAERPATTDLLVAAVPRRVLADHMQLCADAGLEGAAVTVDALALYSALRWLHRTDRTPPSECVVIDLGATSTTLCVTFQGRPWVMRSVLWGVTHLVDALAVRLNTAAHEAERQLPGLTAPQLEPLLAPLLKEIQLTLHAYEANCQTRVWQCLVCGGGSRIKGLASVIARQLELEPVPEGQRLERLAPPDFAVALGLATGTPAPRQRFPSAGPETALSFDFRRTADKAASGPAASKRDLLLLGLGLLFLCLLGTADLWVRMTLKDTRLKELRATLQSHYAQLFQGPPPSPGEELERARANLTASTKLLHQFDGGRSAVLPAMAELVSQLPKGPPLKIESVLLEQATLHVEADTDSFESVDRIKQALTASSKFRSVAMNDVRVGTSAKQVRFRAVLEIAP